MASREMMLVMHATIRPALQYTHREVNLYTPSAPVYGNKGSRVQYTTNCCASIVSSVQLSGTVVSVTDKWYLHETQE